MSTTIRHPVHTHTWWFAAAAAVAIAGLLAALMVAVFSQSPFVDTQAYHHPPPRTLHACFAERPTASIELARTGCGI